MGRRAAVALGMILLAAAPVWAGTKDAPEIDDDPDVTGFDAVDVLAGWIQIADDEMTFTVQVADLTDPQPLTRNNYRFSFVVDTTEYVLEADVEQTVTGRTAEYHLLDANDDRIATVAGTYDTGADEVQWTVPKRFIGDPGPGDEITNTLVETTQFTSDSSAAQDRAPDDGFGDAFAFPAASGDGGTGDEGSSTTTTDDGPAGTLAATGLLVAAAVGTVGYLGYRRRHRIRVTSSDPEQTTHPGEGSNFPILLENRSGEAITVALEAERVPEGWVAFLPLPNVELEPGETRELWLTIKPPADASLGSETEILVRARTKDHQADVVEVRLKATVEEKPPRSTATAGDQTDGA